MDYSKFKGIGEEEDLEEQRAKEADAKSAVAAVKATRKAVGVDDDPSSESDDSDDELSPLFWTKPPSARKKVSEKARAMEELLEKMAYEDRSPESLADSCKERGNVAFQQGNTDDAMILYSEALEWAHKAWTDDKDMSTVVSTILANKAAVELRRKNYRQTIKQAHASLKACPNGPSANKARYRGAKACLELKRPQEALDKFLTNPKLTSVKEEESNLQLVTTVDESKEAKELREKKQQEVTELKKLLEQARALIKKMAAEERERMRAAMEEKKEDHMWRERLATKGVKIGPLAMDIKAMAGAKQNTHLIHPNIDEETGEWSWPCLFMYPEFSQSDFVQQFHESATLEQVLSTMFPPGIPSPAPWDTREHYTLPQLECYFRERAAVPFNLARPLAHQVNALTEELENDVATRKWYRVPLKLTLGEILALKDYVIPGVVLFVIISKHKDNKFRSVFLDSCRRKDGPIEDAKA